MIQSAAASSTAKITEDIASEAVPHNRSTQRVCGCGDTNCVCKEVHTDMCFESWYNDVLDGDGAEWIFCKCSRLLHVCYLL